MAGLRDIQVSVPEAAAAGDTVALHCRYDLESDILYSLKWYRGRDEFFRYIPKELPHTKVFPLEGVDVDVSTFDNNIGQENEGISIFIPSTVS